MLDWRAAAAVLAELQRYAQLLLVGLVLGQTAAGLYMLAAWPAAALSECVLAGAPHGSPRDIAWHACRVALPMTLASLQMALMLPSLLDLRWWGAVAPAQIALFGAIPAALFMVRTAWEESSASRAKCRALEAVGAVALTGLVAAQGLVAVTASNLCWALAMAILWLAPWARKADWRGMLGTAVRPCLGAAAAGIVLLPLADPVSLRLAPVPALCLLTGLGWLVYLVIRGDPAGSQRVLPAKAGDVLTDVAVPTSNI